MSALVMNAKKAGLAAKQRARVVTRVDRRQLVKLPIGLIGFKVGQRLYFHKVGHDVIIGMTPTRAVDGRFVSTRVRRSVRSVTSFGPRAGANEKFTLLSGARRDGKSSAARA